jgi:LacI family transcriptional regulator
MRVARSSRKIIQRAPQAEADATISDVAELAGVSQRTVSRVINESPLVNDSTRTRVQQVIQSLKYRPSLRARALASNQSFMIGLVHDDPNAVVIDHVQRGLFTICANRRYELVVHPCQFGSASLVENVVDFARGTRIDGLVIVPPVAETVGLAEALREHGIPAVGIASVPIPHYGLMLVPRERAATAAIANYLVSLGHRKLGIICGPTRFKSAAERRAGFLDALAKHGITVPAHHIKQGDYEFVSGMSCAAEILSQPDRPTAIFASNDRMAAGVLKVAAQMGIHVPRQLSVVGFDDSIVASMLNPGLTTVNRPMKVLAEQAGRWLTEPKRTRADVAAPSFTDLGLVIRESTGAAPD